MSSLPPLPTLPRPKARLTRAVALNRPLLAAAAAAGVVAAAGPRRRCAAAAAAAAAAARKARVLGAHGGARDDVARVAAGRVVPRQQALHLGRQQRALPQQRVAGRYLEHAQQHEQDVLAEVAVGKVGARAVGVAADFNGVDWVI
jgi:hypothetical protein